MLPGQIGILVLALISVLGLAIMGVCSYQTYKKEKAKAIKMAKRAKAAAAMREADKAYAEELAKESRFESPARDDPMQSPTLIDPPVSVPDTTDDFSETKDTPKEEQDDISTSSLDDFMKSIGAENIDPEKLENTKSDFTEFRF